MAHPKIAIAASFTADLLAEPLRFWLEELDLEREIEFAPYAQVLQQLLDPAGLTAQNGSGVNIVLTRCEDWLGSRPGSELSVDVCAQMEKRLQELLHALKHLAASAAGPLLCGLCPASPAALANAEFHACHERIEAMLAAELADVPGLTLILPSELASLYPVRDYYDARGDANGHIPYTPVYFTALATLLARKIQARLRPACKVIALDCDNTLWGGVCGEVGAEGIALTPPYLALQQAMVAQQQAGVLLCLCSKNSEADVWEVFDRHPEMPLQRRHLAASRINWEPKSANLRSLAQELNLGLDSFVFLDDSPMECAEVAANCPEVLTFPLPQETASLPAFLAHLWALDRLRVTEEDRLRTTRYQQNREREQFRLQSAAFADFLAGLNLQVSIAPVLPEQYDRVAQLTQRTNQFNTTTLRRDAAEIRRLCEMEARECFTITVQDRFGEYGLVGAMLVEQRYSALAVDSLLLSCRALGRGVEHQMLAFLGRAACERGLERVDILFSPTAKNLPARAFLQSVGCAFHRTTAQGERFELPAAFAVSVGCRPESAANFAGSFIDPSVGLAANRPADETLLCSSSLSLNETEQQTYTARMYRIAAELGNIEAIECAIRAWKTRSRPELPNGYVAPQAGLETLLAQMWKEVLGLEQVGAQDDFFELGGDSLKGTVFINRLQERLGAILYIVALFDAPTVSLLARYIEARYPDAARKLSSIPGLQEQALLSVSANPALNGKEHGPVEHLSGLRGRVEAVSSPTVSFSAVARRIEAADITQIRECIAPLPDRVEAGIAGISAGEKNPQAIFVLSPPRSGSTLFRVLLAGHPLLFAPPELELLSFNTMQERRNAFAGRNALWLEGTIRALMEIRGCGAEEARNLMEECEQQNLTTQQFYARMQSEIGSRRLVDKTPAYPLDIRILQRMETDFDNALYIQLLRHPCGMIHSFEEAQLDQIFFRHPHDFSRRELAELIWIVCRQNSRDFLRDVPKSRQFTLHFEDLVEQPERHLQALCEFLQIPYEARMAQPYGGREAERMTDGLHSVSRMLGDVKFHQHKTIDPRTAWRWRDCLSEATLGEVTCELAAEIGYAMPPADEGTPDITQMSDAEVEAMLATLWSEGSVSL